jgi:RsiW-degrading membrane proteinase PrsW (M82 family)
MPELYTIGRDPGCDITLADDSVSRVHAELSFMPDGRPYLRDCGSVNGTRITRAGIRSRIEIPEWLADVETMEFGDVVVDRDLFWEMVRDVRAKRQASAPVRDEVRGVLDEPKPGRDARQTPPEAPETDDGVPGLAEFVPVVAGFARLRERDLIVPSAAFAILVVMLMAAQLTSDSIAFLNTVGLAICLGSLLVVYRMCGKHKPWLAIGAVMLAETVVIRGGLTPFAFVFRTLTGANSMSDSKTLPIAFVGQFIGAGLMEELMKMVPALILIALSTTLIRSRLKKWTASEPLDVMVYACAAATAFVIIETLDLYVPGGMDRTFKETVAKTGDKQLSALRAVLEGSQLAIVRTLDGITGHIAYSGYFGYYVGLGLLRPSQRTRLWLGGWAGAAALHGADNAITGAGSLMGMLLVKLVAISFLVTAILNARKVSPTRAENFATVALSRAR